MDYLEQLDERTFRLLRIASSLIQDYIEPSLDEIYREVRASLMDIGEPDTVRKVQKLRTAINEAVRNVSPEYLAGLTDELQELSVLEAGFSYTVASKAIKEQSLDITVKETAPDKVKRYVKNSILSLERKGNPATGTWQEFVDSYQDTTSRNIQSVIQQAYLEQTQGRAMTLRQISDRVKQVNSELNSNTADRLVRTAVNHFATQGRLAFRDENKSVIEREVPLTVFDSRRSLTCTSIQAEYGQKGWPAGESPIGYNPYHYGCRTQIGFLYKGQKELDGTRSAVGGKRGEDAEEAFEKRKSRSQGTVKYRGRKDSEYFDAGQIKASTPIAKWLSRQPRWYIEESLGKKRADAFISGKLDLAKLTDRDLMPKTVSELGID